MRRLHSMLKESQEEVQNKTTLSPETPPTSSLSRQTQSIPPIMMTSIFSIASSTNKSEQKKPPLCPVKVKNHQELKKQF